MAKLWRSTPVARGDTGERFVAEHHGVRLSDHDAYVVEVAQPHG